MSRIERDGEREDRFYDQVMVDAYGAEEQIMSWYYYLSESIIFPFQAKCIRELRRSPIKLNEIVTVVDMIMDDDSYEMLVEIEFLGQKMGIPLHQLDPVDVDEETLQVIEDWHYWVARGYQFG